MKKRFVVVEETRLVAGTWQMARVVSHGATTRSREAQGLVQALAGG